MRKALLVFRHEVVIMLGKRSFWFTTFLFPLVILGFNLIPQLLVGELGGAGEIPFAQPNASRMETIGYIDEGGLIVEIPAAVPDGWLRAYDDEETARRDLQAGVIGSYVIIPADYVQEGTLTVVDDQIAIERASAVSRLVGLVLHSNLLGEPGLAMTLAALKGDSRLIGRSVSLVPESQGGPSSDDGGGLGGATLPYLLSFILFFVITSSGGYVLQSVAGEKENRTAEVLLVSLRPKELMLGKIVSLGVLSILQVLVWLGAGALVFRQGRVFMGMSLSLVLPPGFVVYVVLYALFGYLLFSSALAAIGALAPNAREGAQFQIMVLAPLMAPMMFGYILAEDPNGPLATALSLFPLTAPVSMVLRLLAAPVPVWQLGVGLVLLAGASYLFVLLSARFFRSDTLLSTSALDWGRFWRELRSDREDQRV